MHWAGGWQYGMSSHSVKGVVGRSRSAFARGPNVTQQFRVKMLSEAPLEAKGSGSPARLFLTI